MRRRHEDDALGVRYQRAESAQPTSQAQKALAEADVILLCPSNPFVSIGPILAVAGMRDLVISSRAPRVAVSPIIGGKALKGPADRMLATMGHEVSAYGVAAWYGDLLDGMVIDEQDAAQGAAHRGVGSAYAGHKHGYGQRRGTASGWRATCYNSRRACDHLVHRRETGVGARFMRIVALVPFKALNLAKSRLAGALLPAGRRALARWMGVRVVEALRESGVVDSRIGLVGADPVLAGRWRGDPRVVTIRASCLSLNRDLETGRRWALRQGTDALLVALGDLPLLTGAAVREMVALSGAPSHAQTVVIAPDRRKDGTNLLLMAPPDLLAFAYGRHSLAHHLNAARRAGAEPAIYRAEETRFDVDTPADLARLVARGLWPPDTHELVIGESDAHDEIG